MSDYEDDDMDIDAPAVQSAISFSAESSKGKRSAANLPIEAEDTLPWYDHVSKRVLWGYVADIRQGWKSTDQTHSQMSPDIKIS